LGASNLHFIAVKIVLWEGGNEGCDVLRWIEFIESIQGINMGYTVYGAKSMSIRRPSCSLALLKTLQQQIKLL
jgi:hypothetical protein